MNEEKTFWESAADTAWGAYLTEAERRVLFRALDLAPAEGIALEVGCEGGRWSRYLVERRDEVVCTDIDPEVLAVCARRLPQARCVLTKPEDDRLPAGDGEVGFLLVYEVTPVTNAPWFAGEAARVLRPGGVLAFSHHNPASLRGAAYRAAGLVDRRGRGSLVYYRGPAYSALRRTLTQSGLAFLHQEGLAWAPFPRRSDSRLIPVATRLEARLGLRRLPTVSPWVLAIARRT